MTSQPRVTVPVDLLKSHTNILQSLIEHIDTLPDGLDCCDCTTCSDIEFLGAYARQALQSFLEAIKDTGTWTPVAAALPAEDIRVGTKRDRVLTLLGLLYEEWAKSHVPWHEEVSDLMRAYNDWLD